MKPLVLLPLALLATLGSPLPAIGQGGVSTPAIGGRNPPPRILPRGVDRALIVCSANDFYPYEIHPQELSYIEAEVQAHGGPPGGSLQDRDGFPAQALQAYFVLRNTLLRRDGRIDLLLFHDDEAGNSLCEIPVSGMVDDDDGDDEFVDIFGVPPGIGTNHLWGSNGIQGDLDDPVIDFQNAAVTKAALQQAVARLGQLAGEGDRILVYLIDHGLNPAGQLDGRFYFEAGNATPADLTDDFVTGDEFDGWLDAALCGVDLGQVVVLADFCHAGAFLPPIVGEEGCGEDRRVGVGASRLDKLAYYNTDAFLINFINPNLWPAGCPHPIFSGSVFFHPFWKAIQAGKGMQEAFDEGFNAKDCWSGVRVGPLQSPVLFDKGLTQKVEFDLPWDGAAETYYDVDWRPDSDHALIVGTKGLVDQYRWGPSPTCPGAPEAYNACRIRAAVAANAALHGVAYDGDGSEALIVGDSGTVMRWNGSNFTNVPWATSQDQTLANLWGVDYSPLLSVARSRGVRALIVGDDGTILEYDGASYARVEPSGGSCANWVAPNADFKAVAFNPSQTYIPPPNPGAYSTTITEATLVAAAGGAWRYEFQRYEHDVLDDYDCEVVSQFWFLGCPCTFGFDLWGVDWDPLGGDLGLMCGRYWNSTNPALTGGVVLRIAPRDGVTTAADVTMALTGQDEVLYDVSFKPNGEYAVVCGNDVILRHALDAASSFTRYDATTTPAVPLALLRGVDFRPNGSHATAVGGSEKVVRYRERLNL